MKTIHVLAQLLFASLLFSCQIEITPLESPASEAAEQQSDQSNNNTLGNEDTEGSDSTQPANNEESSPNTGEQSSNNTNENNNTETPTTNDSEAENEPHEQAANDTNGSNSEQSNQPENNDNEQNEQANNNKNNENGEQQGSSGQSSPIDPETELPIDSNEEGEQTSNETETEQPAEPALPEAEEPASQTISLTIQWDIPVERENNEQLFIYEIGGYEIAYRKVGDSEFQNIIIEDGAVDTYQLINLTEGDYEIKIAAFDINGLYSKFSDTSILPAS